MRAGVLGGDASVLTNAPPFSLKVTNFPPVAISRKLSSGSGLDSGVKYFGAGVLGEVGRSSKDSCSGWGVAVTSTSKVS